MGEQSETRQTIPWDKVKYAVRIIQDDGAKKVEVSDNISVYRVVNVIRIDIKEEKTS